LPPSSPPYAYYYLSTLAGPLVAGMAVYLILSYLFAPLRVTIPLTIIIPVLIFGLCKYYTANNNNNNDDKSKNVATTKITARTIITNTTVNSIYISPPKGGLIFLVYWI
jgi:hypothetical protein